MYERKIRTRAEYSKLESLLHSRVEVFYSTGIIDLLFCQLPSIKRGHDSNYDAHKQSGHRGTLRKPNDTIIVIVGQLFRPVLDLLGISSSASIHLS
jgi:hypothetical protein